MTVDVVMIPGFLCDGRVFESQVEALRAHPATDSVSVADITSADSIEAMATTVLDHAPERCCIVGLSLGAIVAAEIGHIAPHRLDGVALLDTNLDRPDDVQIARRRRWAEDVDAGRFLQVVHDHLVDPLTADPGAHGPLIVDMATRCGAPTFVQQNTALLHRRDRRDDLASLSVPILIACGREDELCPPRLHRELAERHPGAHLVVVDGAGHLSTVDRPDELSAALADWLTDCENHRQLPTGGIRNAHINH